MRLSVNTLLFASLHIHEGHRGSYRLLVFRCFPPLSLFRSAGDMGCARLDLVFLYFRPLH